MEYIISFNRCIYGLKYSKLYLGHPETKKGSQNYCCHEICLANI